MSEFPNIEVERLKQEIRLLKGKIEPLEFANREIIKAAESYQEENGRLREALILAKEEIKALSCCQEPYQKNMDKINDALGEK